MYNAVLIAVTTALYTFAVASSQNVSQDALEELHCGDLDKPGSRTSLGSREARRLQACLQALRADERVKRDESSSSWRIFPGTNWCGAGDSADHVDDLGYFNETDACCRAHDRCRPFINAGKTRWGCTNPESQAIFGCSC